MGQKILTDNTAVYILGVLKFNLLDFRVVDNFYCIMIFESYGKKYRVLLSVLPTEFVDLLFLERRS